MPRTESKGSPPRGLSSLAVHTAAAVAQSGVMLEWDVPGLELWVPGYELCYSAGQSLNPVIGNAPSSGPPCLLSAPPGPPASPSQPPLLVRSHVPTCKAGGWDLPWDLFSPLSPSLNHLFHSQRFKGCVYKGATPTSKAWSFVSESESQAHRSGCLLGV